MNEQAIDVLVRRLERLERQDRRIERTGSLLFLGVAAALLLGQSQCNSSKSDVSRASDIVEAQEFVLRDTSGKVRAKIGMTTGLGPELSLLDSTGKKRLSLSISDIGGGNGVLGFDDKDGHRRILLKENVLWLSDR
jgi:hypothetical protein